MKNFLYSLIFLITIPTLGQSFTPYRNYPGGTLFEETWTPISGQTSDYCFPGLYDQCQQSWAIDSGIVPSIVAAPEGSSFSNMVKIPENVVSTIPNAIDTAGTIPGITGAYTITLYAMVDNYANPGGIINFRFGNENEITVAIGYGNGFYVSVLPSFSTPDCGTAVSTVNKIQIVINGASSEILINGTQCGTNFTPTLSQLDNVQLSGVSGTNVWVGPITISQGTSASPSGGWYPTILADWAGQTGAVTMGGLFAGTHGWYSNQYSSDTMSGVSYNFTNTCEPFPSAINIWNQSFTGNSCESIQASIPANTASIGYYEWVDQSTHPNESVGFYFQESEPGTNGINFSTFSSLYGAPAGYPQELNTVSLSLVGSTETITCRNDSNSTGVTTVSNGGVAVPISQNTWYYITYDSNASLINHAWLYSASGTYLGSCLFPPSYTTSTMYGGASGFTIGVVNTDTEPDAATLTISNLLFSYTDAPRPLLPPGFPQPFTPTTLTASSCNESDVNAIINGPTHYANDGDTIKIPAGTCTWDSGIALPSGVGLTIIGAGTPNSGASTTGASTPQTIIEDNIPKTSTPEELIVATPDGKAPLTRISNMEIEPAPSATPYTPIAIFGKCLPSRCPQARVDNITFPSTWAATTGSLQDSTLIMGDNIVGVFDHNSVTGNMSDAYLGFLNLSDGNWMGIGQYGDYSWTYPDTFGSSNSVIMENNIFNTNVFVIDCDTGDSFEDSGGCRYVSRFNDIENAGNVGIMVNHGTETGGRMRGGRTAEIYGNTINCQTSAGCDAGAGFRSGVTMMWGNTLQAQGSAFFNSYLNVNTYRTFAGFDPWGYCNGLSPYDNNSSTTYATGTLTGVSGGGTTALTVSDSTKNWTTNEWISPGTAYFFVDTTVKVTQGNWTGPSGYEITSMTPTSLTLGNYNNDYWNGPPTFAVGDSYEILQVNACLDQPNRGVGVLLYNDPAVPYQYNSTLTATYPNQALDPSYEFADTHTGNFGSASILSDTNMMVANRDFYGEVSQTAQTSATSPFNGTVGTGFGTLANRPTSCTTGVAYWATDQGNWDTVSGGIQGELYTCTAPNTWSMTYEPYTYPDPLDAGAAPVNGSSVINGNFTLSGEVQIN